MCEEESFSEQEFCFNQWADQHGLSRATTGILVKEGCSTKDILEVLSASAVNKLCLSIGQGIAFRKGLKALGNTIGGRQTDANINSPQDNGLKRRREDDTLSQDSHPPSGQRVLGEELERQSERELDQYLKDPEKGSREKTPGTDPRRERYGSDPRNNLVIKSQRRKALKIINFVPESVTKRVALRGRDRMALIQDSEGKLAIKTDEELPAHLTLSEWGAANLRLMQHLLDTGELARSDIEYYNAYTLMIFELVENYEWLSILAFDTRYRELQAHTEFAWGTPTRGLEVSTLIPRARKEKSTDRFKGRSTQRGEKRGICRAFARDGSCPYGERCIFTHKVGKPEAPKNGPPTVTNREH